MKAGREPSQTAQRVKVGSIGLAAVVGLIALASAMLGSVTHEKPVTAAGAANQQIVDNLSGANAVDGAGEPLAELGVSPSADNTAQP